MNKKEIQRITADTVDGLNALLGGAFIEAYEVGYSDGKDAGCVACDEDEEYRRELEDRLNKVIDARIGSRVIANDLKPKREDTLKLVKPESVEMRKRVKRKEQLPSLVYRCMEKGKTYTTGSVRIIVNEKHKKKYNSGRISVVLQNLAKKNKIRGIKISPRRSVWVK